MECNNKEFETLSELEREVFAQACLIDTLLFTRFFFREGNGDKFMVKPHHVMMAKTIDKVFAGEIERLVINIPPGYTKTELVVIALVAKGYALNPRAKFLHTSYSDDLIISNSGRIQDIIRCDAYQSMWPVEIRSDSSAKKNWSTTAGGFFRCASTGGGLTGFRAGRTVKGFSGALIIDDPLKPDDALSDTLRNRVNQRFTNTLRSRLAHDKVPVIVIMQRLHEADPTAFLLKGATDEKWHHLCIPALVEDYKVRDNERFTHAIPIPIPESIPLGPLWPEKDSEETLLSMRKSDPYTYSSQYDQSPTPMGGGMFKNDWWRTYTKRPPFDYRLITCDTAQKKDEQHDWSVFQCWGKNGKEIYLIDQFRGKWEAAELRHMLRTFIDKQLTESSNEAQNGKLRAVYVEDKSSGTGLIQDVNKIVSVPIIPLPRLKDKITRAMDAVPYVAQHRVYVPLSSQFTGDFLYEMAKFSAMMTHRHDDQADCCIDAVNLMLGTAAKRIQVTVV